MKILLISSLYGRIGGGAGLSVERLATGLMRRGLSTRVLTLAMPSDHELTGDVPVEQIQPWNLYSIYEKDSRPAVLKAIWQTIDFWNPHAYMQLRRHIRRESPDVVHVHKLRGLSPAVWHAVRAAGVPTLIQTCRDYECMSPDGALRGRVGRLALKQHWLMKAYQVPRARWSRAISAVTAPSRFTLDTLRAAGFFETVPTYVVPNTHGFTADELAKIRERSAKSLGGGVRFLYLGRLEDSKGIEIMCKAATAARGNFHLDIAGWGPMRPYIESIAEQSGRIVYHGAVDGPVKHELLSQCTALLVPSIWPEVFGNVIIEGHAFGKPSLAAKIGGIPEIVSEGETGYLFPAGDCAALTAILENVTAQPHTVQRMAVKCFQASENFTVDAIAGRYAVLYR